MTTQTPNKGRSLAFVGVLLLVVQLWPMSTAGGTLLAIFHAFGSHGTSDPAFTGAAIGEALVTTIVASLFAVPSAALFLIALTFSRYRAEWFFWLLVIDSGLLLFLFPIGTAISMFFLTYCLIRRHEFLRPTHNATGIA